jgi:hypothetical protein
VARQQNRTPHGQRQIGGSADEEVDAAEGASHQTLPSRLVAGDRAWVARTAVDPFLLPCCPSVEPTHLLTLAQRAASLNGTYALAATSFGVHDERLIGSVGSIDPDPVRTP